MRRSENALKLLNIWGTETLRILKVSSMEDLLDNHIEWVSDLLGNWRNNYIDIL